MTPVFCCGFECGAGHFNVAAPNSISTSTVRSGVRSLRMNPAAQTAQAITAITIPIDLIVARFYIRFASLPTTDSDIFTIPLGTKAGIRFKNSDSKLYTSANLATASVTGIAVTTGVWYRIDYKFNGQSNPWLQSLSVDGTEVTSSSAFASVTGTTSSPNFGSAETSRTYDIFFDDFIISNTIADYPIGEGKVMGYVPNADGTHTAAGTTTVKGTIATPVGTAITNATTDAFNWVNARPILGGATDNTRLINAQTNAATTYVEVAFEDSVEVNAPRAVEVLTADRQASTATGDMTVKINDNGTEATVIARATAAGTTTDKYATKQFATAPTGGAWNLSASGNASFQNIKARFGYSGDATPDQYWRGIMIEAESAETVVVNTVKAFGLLGVG